MEVGWVGHEEAAGYLVPAHLASSPISVGLQISVYLTDLREELLRRVRTLFSKLFGTVSWALEGSPSASPGPYYPSQTHMEAGVAAYVYVPVGRDTAAGHTPTAPPPSASLWS